MHKGMAIGIAVTMLVLLGACGAAGPSLTTAEKDYLDSVRSLETEVRDVLDEIGEAMSITWPIRCTRRGELDRRI